MKKVTLAALLLLVSAAVFAQSGTSYLSISPGYYWNSGTFSTSEGQYFANGKGKNGFMGSLDYGYFFTDNVGIHAGYMYFDSKVEWSVGYQNYTFGPYEFSNNVSVLEVGPEFVGRLSESGEIYGQFNVGYTFGGKDVHVDIYGTRYDLGNVYDNDWVFGAAFGYRHYWGDTVGMAVQGSYHYANGWELNDWWDARVGVTFRF